MRSGNPNKFFAIPIGIMVIASAIGNLLTHEDLSVVQVIGSIIFILFGVLIIIIK